MEIPTLKGLENNESSQSKVVTSVQIKQNKSKKSLPGNSAYGTGKRKNSIARVWLKPGKGVVTVNKKQLDTYFPRESYRYSIVQPLVETNTLGQFDIVCTVKGGGATGQAGAILHGVAKALDCISEDYHTVLRKGGFLTRDSRIVERKKYGKRKARKSTQFSKR